MNRKKLIYSILKEIDKGNIPKFDEYELNKEQWNEIIKNEELLNGVSILYADDEVYYVSIDSAKLTFKGINFLEENNTWTKTYNSIKEARDWFKI